MAQWGGGDTKGAICHSPPLPPPPPKPINRLAHHPTTYQRIQDFDYEENVSVRPRNPRPHTKDTDAHLFMPSARHLAPSTPFSVRWEEAGHSPNNNADDAASFRFALTPGVREGSLPSFSATNNRGIQAMRPFASIATNNRVQRWRRLASTTSGDERSQCRGRFRGVSMGRTRHHLLVPI